MSANIVSEKQLRLIAAIYHFSDGIKPDLSFIWYLEQTIAELEKQNIFSITFRYGKAQDFVKLNLKETWAELDSFIDLYKEFSTVAKLKLIQHYVYQSSEHPEWSMSLASKICDSCTSKLISQLPGYNEAAWGIA